MVRLHYLQGMTVDQAAQELSVSPRQAYRDLRQGEESVADVLWARHDLLHRLIQARNVEEYP